MKTVLIIGFLLITSFSIAQNELLCVGRYWTENETNLRMKNFSRQWDVKASWEKRAAAYMFLAYHLKLNLGKVKVTNGVHEGFVKVLPKDQLKVFTKDNPRPKNAIIGDREIIKYLNLK